MTTVNFISSDNDGNNVNLSSITPTQNNSNDLQNIVLSSTIVTNNDMEEDDVDNGTFPLLASKKIKMGAFSIRYSPNSDLCKSRMRDYLENDGKSSRSVYYDFPTGVDPSLLYASESDTLDFESDGKSSSIFHQALYKLLSSCKRIQLLPFRIFLLALYLSFTLCSFWILDSVKEPTLAILVNGDLGRHQPRAKMVSFFVVVGMVVGMEVLNSMRQRIRKFGQTPSNNVDTEMNFNARIEQANAALEQSWKDRNLPQFLMRNSNNSGGNWSGWRKMGINIGFFGRHFRFNQIFSQDDDDEDLNFSSKMTTLPFYILGSFYVHAFVAVAVALRQHPSFGRRINFHIEHAVMEDKINGSDWYYPALGYVLFTLIESFGSVSITAFWAFANSHLTLEVAELHYGSIVAIAQIGAICGSTLSSVLGRRRGQSITLDDEGRVDATFTDKDKENDAQVTPMLLFCACGCIGISMAVMALYSLVFARPMKQSAILKQDCTSSRVANGQDLCKPKQISQTNEKRSSNVYKDMFGGLLLIFRYNYLIYVLAVSVLYEIALTCMHYELNLIGLDRFGVGISIKDKSDIHHESTTLTKESGITYIQFMGWYGQTVNILSLFLSFYAFPRLIKHYGLSTTIRIFPTVLLGVTICAFVIFPHNLYFLFISLSICKALTYSVHDPSEEVLYMPTSDDVKFRAKFWIDVVGQRVAKAFGSAINNRAGNIEGIIMYGSLPSIMASVALWLACYQVGILFDELIMEGNSVGQVDDFVDKSVELLEEIDVSCVDGHEIDEDKD